MASIGAHNGQDNHVDTKHVFVMTIQVIAIAQVDRRSDEGLDEIEDCWKLRDAGYNTVWLSEVRVTFMSAFCT